MALLPVTTDFLRTHRLESPVEDIRARAAFVMEGRRSRLPVHPKEDTMVTLVVLVAVLADTPRGPVVKFVPGPTGFESFYWKAETSQEIAVLDDHTTKPSIFGGFELADWSLCAGTPGRWDRLTVLVRDMKEMAAYFASVVPVSASAPVGEETP